MTMRNPRRSITVAPLPAARKALAGAKHEVADQ